MLGDETYQCEYTTGGGCWIPRGRAAFHLRLLHALSKVPRWNWERERERERESFMHWSKSVWMGQHIFGVTWLKLHALFNMAYLYRHKSALTHTRTHVWIGKFIPPSLSYSFWVCYRGRERERVRFLQVTIGRACKKVSQSGPVLKHGTFRRSFHDKNVFFVKKRS